MQALSKNVKETEKEGNSKKVKFGRPGFKNTQIYEKDDNVKETSKKKKSKFRDDKITKSKKEKGEKGKR